MTNAKYKTLSLSPEAAGALTKIKEDMERDYGMSPMSFAMVVQRLCTLYERGELASILASNPSE